MSEAIIQGLRNKEREGSFVGGDSPVTLKVYDPNPKQREIFVKKFGAEAHADLKGCVRGSDVMLLACKPQNLKNVAKEAQDAVGEQTVVLSILAGATVDALQGATGVAQVVRSMPNTPAAVQEGMTVWFASSAVTRPNKNLCAQILSSFGEEHEVDEEPYLDMATALSGSGPAYALLLMESMIETGVHFGFSRQVATKLVHQTVKGTALYAQSTAMNSASLRADITSPGGTTAAALFVLEKGGFRTVVAEGMWGAYRRSLELGGGDSNVGPGRYK
jgi:pyrroline-5-carboxylate reductase